jgi:predicted DCC family thiol-disulfide oxidoreductase YuxK
MTQKTVEELVNSILESIDREREREIISRRYGLFDRKETLEQIGELLGITRERVRQLEKSVISRLRATAEAGEMMQLNDFEATLLETLDTLGSVARISDLSNQLTQQQSNKIEQARLAFIAELCPKVDVISENDNFYQSVVITQKHTAKVVQTQADAIIKAIKKLGEPATIAVVAQQISDKDARHVQAVASTSKQLATLNDKWGLVKWPTVNPKNIRDKIYVILQQNGKHMHFNEIASAIKDSDFKRKNVTTQAIHNELIKDKRFVLIGRGIYALTEWGYKKGTVADIITHVLKEANEPLHRDEIVKRVLKSRYVKETTILLNLQGKTQFKRVAKATYALSEA